METAQLAEQLRAAIGAFVRVARKETDTPSTPQTETLSILEREGGLSVAALAQRRHVRHQSMRLVTAQLVAEGLVQTHPDVADGRSALLTITATGRNVLAASRAARNHWIQDALDNNLSVNERAILAAAVPVLAALTPRKGTAEC